MSSVLDIHSLIVLYFISSVGFPIIIVGVDNLQVLVVRDIMASHRLEMLRLELAVNEFDARLREELGQGDQRNLRCTWLEREHAFAEESATHGDAVEASDELFALPDFYARSIASALEFDVSRLHLRAEPSAFLFFAQRATEVDDALEGGIDGDLDLVALHAVEQRTHGVGDMDILGRDDEALHRAPPLDVGLAGDRVNEFRASVFGAEGVPGEDTV